MRRLLRTLWTPLYPVLVFLVCQLAGGLVLYVAPGGLAWSLLAVDVLCVLWLVFGRLIIVRDVHVDLSWRSGRFLWAFFGALAVILALNIFSEWMSLPDLIEDAVCNLVRSPLGVVAIALLGPVAEELCFRGAVIGGMLRQGCRPWTAVAVSALLFGLIHMNPAQVPFAAAMGLVLGVLYLRTGSLLLPILVHVVNNSLSVLQIRLMGDAARSFTLTDWMGTPMAAFTALASFSLGVFLLWRFLRLDKRTLRREIRAMKSLYSAESLDNISLEIETYFSLQDQWDAAQTVLLYSALPDEVNTDYLLLSAESDGKTVLLPRVDGERLTLHVYSPDSMAPGAFGVMEPQGPEFPPSRYGEIELAIVPGMAFDRRGHRLGRGKGYYDRLLPLLPAARLVGLCFPFQVVASVPHEAHDAEVRHFMPDQLINL